MNSLSLYNNLKQAMQQHQNKKYSKVSAALKCYFLRNMYYHRFSIKEASRRCKINYSTAKIILRDLTAKERNFVKILIRQKENRQQRNEKMIRECGHTFIECQDGCENHLSNKIQVVSRVGFDFFTVSQPV